MVEFGNGASEGVVLLTTTQVNEWRREKTKLEKKIATAQQQLMDINKRLDAVAILSPRNEAQLNEPVAAQQTRAEPETKMIDAVANIVSAASAPMTKAAIKEALDAVGFDPSRQGNYFYTVIKRLKDRNRIIVLADGRVCTAQANEHGNAGLASGETPGASV